jgi:hypothetical protein
MQRFLVVGHQRAFESSLIRRIFRNDIDAAQEVSIEGILQAY